MMRNKGRVWVIGLTGTIGTGKSTVAQILREQGVPVIDADQVVRRLSEKDGPVWAAIYEVFGSEVMNPDGSLNRKRLGAEVFGNPEALKRLNAATHPPILDEIHHQVEAMAAKGYDGPVVVEAPVLFESGYYKQVDEIWVVTAPEAQLIERLIERDGFDRAEAEKRIQSQMPQAEKAKAAHRVLCNDGDIQALKAQVRGLLAGRNTRGT